MFFGVFDLYILMFWKLVKSLVEINLIFVLRGKDVIGVN